MSIPPAETSRLLDGIAEQGKAMERKRYDLNFKKMVVAKGKEIGNMTAVARQHDLDPKLVLK